VPDLLSTLLVAVADLNVVQGIRMSQKQRCILVPIDCVVELCVTTQGEQGSRRGTKV
jgi:hypothetical protein